MYGSNVIYKKKLGKSEENLGVQNRENLEKETKTVWQEVQRLSWYEINYSNVL